MAQDIFAFITEKTGEGKKVALATVTKTSGSSPASVGQMVAVTANGDTAGTVGGGASEYRVIQQAMEALQSGKQIFEFSFDHAENGMVCGGGMSGFGNVIGNEVRLLIFGGGHVAQSLAPLAVAAGFSVTIVEDRAELAKEFSGVNYIVSTPESFAQDISVTEKTYAVICTRGHRTDDAALRFCLEMPLPYIGMIGSVKKVKTLFAELEKENISEEKRATIYAPIGLDIASEAPAEIAVSILAEIIMLKNNGTLKHKRDTM